MTLHRQRDMTIEDERNEVRSLLTTAAMYKKAKREAPFFFRIKYYMQFYCHSFLEGWHHGNERRLEDVLREARLLDKWPKVANFKVARAIRRKAVAAVPLRRRLRYSFDLGIYVELKAGTAAEMADYRETGDRSPIVPSTPSAFARGSVSVRQGLQDFSNSKVVKRILVADHNPPVLEVMKALLEARGYNVRVVDSSQSALKEGPLFKPHLLIIDPIMPVISGVEAARRLTGATNCNILFDSCASDPEFVAGILREVMCSGCMADYLLRPFEERELLDAVSSLMEKGIEVARP